ncbi:MAG TPA: C39 family peptidase [Ktedonobacterales bacterium]
MRQVPPAHAASQQYDEFWRNSSASAFAAWSANGVAASTSGGQAALQLAPSRKARLACNSGDIDGGAASFDTRSGLCAGTDPMAPGSYLNDLSYYNGGSFYFGTLLSPVHTTGSPIDHVIASWDATTPAGTWMEVHVRVLQAKSWTHWYILPIWASDFSTIHRHSVNGQSDTDGGVATDTFFTKPGQVATAYQLSLTLFTTTPTLSPSVRALNAIASYDASQYPSFAPDTSVWGTNLPVPQRSQMLPQYQGLGYGGGGEVWCSPTSTSMVMAYWSNVLGQSNLNQTVPDAAQGTYDFAYGGTGNWPFNTAYAASYGLTAFVTRMDNMSQVEQWIKAGVPIVISVAFNNGQLPGEPVKNSPGHLLVIRGFTSSGDVITNDPAAATDDQVQIVYHRADLEYVWQYGSNGTAYVMYPQGWPVPTTDAAGSW